MIDENVAVQVTESLRGRGDDVLDIKERGWFGRTDDEILTLAQDEQRVIVTYDVDFAAVRRLKEPHPGILFIRLRSLRPGAVAVALKRFLVLYENRDLSNTLATIGETRVRFRRTR